MPKTYIGRALVDLSKKVGGPDLCDKIAKRLSRMTSAEVNQINSALNFGWLKWTMRNVQTPIKLDAADLRRGAMLVQRALNLVNQRAAADGWDENQHRAVIQAGIQAPVIHVPGYYLKGSFWGFANHTERAWTREAWQEALRLVIAGIRVCNLALAGDARSTLVKGNYFGATTPTTLQLALTNLQTSMANNTVGICYVGGGRTAGPEYIERGQGSGTSGPLEWGWASPNGEGNNIGFGDRFFRLADTSVTRANLHSFLIPGAMEVTRGGAVVHELTHRYLGTRDLDLCLAQYGDIWPTLNLQAAPPGAKAYGPRGCMALARHHPADALTNADNFRLFCEDAMLI